MTKNDTTVQGKIEALRAHVAWFDSDDFSLEVSMEKFKEAEMLAREIETELAELKNEVEVVKRSFES